MSAQQRLEHLEPLASGQPPTGLHRLCTSQQLGAIGALKGAQCQHHGVAFARGAEGPDGRHNGGRSRHKTAARAAGRGRAKPTADTASDKANRGPVPGNCTNQPKQLWVTDLRHFIKNRVITYVGYHHSQIMRDQRHHGASVCMLRGIRNIGNST